MESQQELINVPVIPVGKERSVKNLFVVILVEMAIVKNQMYVNANPGFEQ